MYWTKFVWSLFTNLRKTKQQKMHSSALTRTENEKKSRLQFTSTWRNSKRLYKNCSLVINWIKKFRSYLPEFRFVLFSFHWNGTVFSPLLPLILHDGKPYAYELCKFMFIFGQLKEDEFKIGSFDWMKKFILFSFDRHPFQYECDEIPYKIGSVRWRIEKMEIFGVNKCY